MNRMFTCCVRVQSKGDFLLATEMESNGNDSAKTLLNEEDKSKKNKNQDKGRRKGKKGKEILEFKTDPCERRKVLHQRRKGLFQAGFKINKMTGADVLLVVQNERERRFYGTGPLREQYLVGKLRGIGKEEVRDSDGGSCSNGAVVGPLEVTPSPTTGQNNSDRVSAIVGIPRSRKRLNMSEGDIPEPVKKLLTDKPIPVVLEGDIHGQTNEVENA